MSGYQATHRVTYPDGSQDRIMLTDSGAAYTPAEWDANDSADLELSGGEWLFQGQPFAGRIQLGMTYRLTSRTTTAPDLGGWCFFVQAGRDFDSLAYAAAYELNHADIDARDIGDTADAARRLTEGQWLEVTHDADPPTTTTDRPTAAQGEGE